MHESSAWQLLLAVPVIQAQTESPPAKACRQLPQVDCGRLEQLNRVGRVLSEHWVLPPAPLAPAPPSAAVPAPPPDPPPPDPPAPPDPAPPPPDPPAPPDPPPPPNPASPPDPAAPPPLPAMPPDPAVPPPLPATSPDPAVPPPPAPPAVPAAPPVPPRPAPPSPPPPAAPADPASPPMPGPPAAPPAPPSMPGPPAAPAEPPLPAPHPNINAPPATITTVFQLIGARSIREFSEQSSCPPATWALRAPPWKISRKADAETPRPAFTAVLTLCRRARGCQRIRVIRTLASAVRILGLQSGRARRNCAFSSAEVRIARLFWTPVGWQ